jgi:hypothetical protein
MLTDWKNGVFSSRAPGRSFGLREAMPLIQRKQARTLERIANRLLKRSPDLVKPRPLEINRVSDHCLDRRLAREARHRTRQQAVSRYRMLPPEQRRELVDRFKRARQINPKLDWAQWLSQAIYVDA